MVKLEESFAKVKEFVNKTNEKTASEKGISRETFFNMLRDYGEAMTDEEITVILETLRGDPNYKNLPDNINFQTFFEDILLFEAVDKDEKENK